MSDAVPLMQGRTGVSPLGGRSMIDGQNEALRGEEDTSPLVSYAVLDRMLWARIGLT